MVRAILCDERNGAIVTGGEDAKLNIWRDPNHGSALYGSSDVDMDMEVDDHDNEVERARRANPKKRSVGSDAEDDAMVRVLTWDGEDRLAQRPLHLGWEEKEAMICRPPTRTFSQKRALILEPHPAPGPSIF